MKELNLSGVGTIFIESDKPTKGQEETAKNFPGLMAMMPTHSAVMQSTSWQVHRRPPRKVDSDLYLKPIEDGPLKGTLALGPEYQEAYAAMRKAALTGDPEIDEKEDGMFVIALRSSLDEGMIEHADYNTGRVGEKLVCLEYIGCEYSSENWTPDYKYTSPKTAFTEAEIDLIFTFLDQNPSVLP